MDSLVGYGSDDDIETERYGHQASVGSHRRREDDTNYDQVNMDLSEDSQGEESEPELPQAESRVSRQTSGEDQSSSTDSRDAERPREYGKERERDRHRDRDRDRDEKRDKRRQSPRRDRERAEKDRRSPRKDDKYRSDRSQRPRDAPRRGLLGDRPDDKHSSTDSKMPALMDLKPFGSDGPRLKSQDARDAVSPRFVDRRERDHDRERDRGRDRDAERDRERERDYDGRHNRRSEDRRSSGRDRGSERSRSRGHAYPPPHTSNERRSPSSGDYRPSSYKVNKKLEVMEKMGLQIKTPDGSMTTAQQLRAAAGDSGLPGYCNPGSNPASKILDQVQKRKLLWSSKTKTAEEEAAKWSGARFSQDNDGKQVSKFMRLMGIKDPNAVKGEVPEDADPNKKQEELFQAMQAQYEVARATTHTMRGVGLGFQRGQY